MSIDFIEKIRKDITISIRSTKVESAIHNPNTGMDDILSSLNHVWNESIKVVSDDNEDGEGEEISEGTDEDTVMAKLRAAKIGTISTSRKFTIHADISKDVWTLGKLKFANRDIVAIRQNKADRIERRSRVQSEIIERIHKMQDDDDDINLGSATGFTPKWMIRARSVRNNFLSSYN